MSTDRFLWEMFFDFKLYQQQLLHFNCHALIGHVVQGLCTISVILYLVFIFYALLKQSIFS